MSKEREYSENSAAPADRKNSAAGKSREEASSRPAHAQQRNKRGRRKKRAYSVGRALLIVLIALLLGTAALGLVAYHEVNGLQKDVDALQSEAGTLVDAATELDLDRVRDSLEGIDSRLLTIDEKLYGTLYLSAGNLVPSVGQDLDTAHRLLQFARKAIAAATPAIEDVRRIGVPDKAMLQSDDPDVSALLGYVSAYMPLYEIYYPEISALLDEFETIPHFETDFLENKIAPYRDKISVVHELQPLLDRLPTHLVSELAALVQDNPIDSLYNGRDYNVKLLDTYLRKYLELKDEIYEILQFTSTLEASMLDTELLDTVHGKSAEILELMDEAEPYLPVAEMLLENTDYANYLMVAQNTAELRACGGFPGNLTLITMRDGWMHLGGVGRIYDILPFVYPAAIQPPLLIKELFGSFCQTQIRDASFNPHWPFVASVWAYAYENDFYQGDHLDGIISCTPQLVHELVGLTGDITLFNGVTINGENTMRYLMHEVYFQYHTAGCPQYSKEGNEDMVFDQVFDEVMGNMLSDLSLERLEGLLELVRRCVDQRVIMLWMADQDKEQIAMDAGMSGSLNFDPEKPQIGVYYSIQDSNKAGYYVDLSTAVGAGTPNDDGSVTYPVTVVVRNTMTKEDIELARYNDYKLMGTYDNNILSSIYFTSPAGGSISEPTWNIELNGPSTYADLPFLLTAEYEGLTFYYHRAFFLVPGEELTVHYTVTTAPGVSTVPTVSQTPTCTNFR